MVKPLRFHPEDFERANKAWGCNCGPGALAAILGLSLDELRPSLGNFELKHYMNPTLMFMTLRRLKVEHERSLPAVTWPNYGLARVQWSGPWTEPGVPDRARQRHTHWVGATWADGRQEYGIFDVNALANGTGWCSVGDWRDTIVPFILGECEPKANGMWHLTHVIEIKQ